MEGCIARARETSAQLDKKVEAILRGVTKHPLYYPDGRPVLGQDGKPCLMTFPDILAAARSKFGANIFYSSYGASPAQWKKFSEESSAKAAADRQGVKKDIFSAQHKSYVVLLYSTAPGACLDAGGGIEQVEGGSVEMRVQAGHWTATTGAS